MEKKIALTGLACALVLGARALAQPVLTVVGSTLNASTNTFADDPTDPWVPVLDADSAVNWIPGLLGSDLGALCVSDSDYRVPIPGCELHSLGRGHAKLTGTGTGYVQLRWKVTASTFQSCDRAVYNATAIADFEADVTFVVTGVAPGTPVTLNYNWRALSSTTNEPEAGAEDDARVELTTLSLNGTELTGGYFNMGGGTAIRSLTNQTGTLTVVAGTPVTVRVSARCTGMLNNPGQGAFWQDQTYAQYQGLLVLTNSFTQPPVFPNPVNVYGEFGVDLGSDREIGDANFDGDKAFDPGDAYPWRGPAIAPPGVNGVRNDALLFLGSDPDPSPVIPFGPPYCSNMPQPLPTQWFDADDFDALEASLAGVIPPVPLSVPLVVQSACLHGVDELLISFEDDRAYPVTSNPFGQCEIPVFDFSPSGQVYGTAARKDEVLGLSLTQTGPIQYSGTPYGVLDEVDLHTSLSPNPLGGSNFDDDDVDGLDVSDFAGQCPIWYVSSDHETPQYDRAGGWLLDPGTIYQPTAGGLVPVVIGSVHLGLPIGTDVRGFEFVKAFDPVTNTPNALAVVFSVARDDPSSALDESGGRDPRMIYISFLTGSSFPLLTYPLQDDIDAITAYDVPLIVTAPPVGNCPTDLTRDGRVNTADLVYLLSFFGGAGPGGGGGGGNPDFNGDGIVNTADLVRLLSDFGRTCP